MRINDSSKSFNSNEGDGESAIVVENLEKVYETATGPIQAVDDVSFTVDRGSIVGLLGKNGAGKTTTIKTLLGLIIPDNGTVRISGIDPHQNPSALYRHVAAMLEGARNTYWRLTARENLRFFASLAGSDPRTLQERQEHLLSHFDLQDRADVPVNELSRGMQQKISLICTLSRDTSVVFLDEPTLGLDVKSTHDLRTELRKFVERRPITIVLCSHDMDVVQDLCDRIIVMSDGKIVADDDTDALLEAFDTQAYRITIDTPVTQTVKEGLDSAFADLTWEEMGQKTRMTVTLAEATLFDLFDRLKSEQLSISHVESVDPDLEEVFLALVRERSRESNASISASNPSKETS